ncbi:endonuclease domain-containing 1 protein-like protein [Lates japonicus]|uniref:Endonuclease domain-containing 1 protein-like protein n=1 Tax=Lates japonicus TaxID=270547 RepID=A0AAD3NIT8_LATJO|nr:endonuclease domain-containing 1 protein-like protein [Lates japonicus]
MAEGRRPDSDSLACSVHGDDHLHSASKGAVLAGLLLLGLWCSRVIEGAQSSSTAAIPSESWVRMHLFCTCVLSFSLLTASPLVSATVSNSFRDCSQFFYMQTPPAGITGTSLRRICQKYADKLLYATLYDSSRRLPLFSA